MASVSARVLEFVRQRLIAPLHVLPLLLAAWGLAATAEAQIYPTTECNAAGWPDPPTGLEPDLNQCCYNFTYCYQTNACTVSVDWPDAFSRQCLGCNLVALGCMGMAYTGVTPTWQCPASCNYDGASCGSPDGCGGVCVSEELCPFLSMHPEFVAVLF
jgi:hypothetical protein